MEAVAESGGRVARTGRVPTVGWRHALAAVALSSVVTAAVVVPMSYQARAARAPLVTTTTTPVAGSTTVPTEVLGTTLDRNQLGTAPATIVRLEPAEDLEVSSTGPTGMLIQLDGAVLARPDAWVIADSPDALVVRFWLNDPTGTGAPDQVDHVPPFTLVSGPLEDGVAPLEVDALPEGVNTVLAELTNDDGTVEYQRASFTVD